MDLTLLSRMAARPHAWAGVACAWLCCAVALAQTLPAIAESVLRDPWVRHLAVIESLAARIETADAGVREPLADTLSMLQASLGEYETGFDRAIDRLVADRNFGLAATQVSAELGEQAAQIALGLDTLYRLLGVQARPDVEQAQEALGELQRTLSAGSPFERDVMLAMAGRAQMAALATRWWNGEERAIALAKRVAALRERVEGLPSAR